MPPERENPNNPPPALTDICGIFARITFAGSVGSCLRKGEASRPPARFNRPGQDALYLSPDPASARVAIGGTVRADDPPRVLLRFEVSACQLVDLRLPSASALYESASQPWRDPLAAGRTPRTWEVSDGLRSQGHTGLIDPSRRVPGLWHVTLFRWNEPGAPTVRPIGTPEPIEIETDISSPCERCKSSSKPGQLM